MINRKNSILSNTSSSLLLSIALLDPRKLPMYLIFDTETTGLPKRWDAPITDTDNWPRCVQIAWQLHDELGNLVEHQDFLIKPDGFNIPYEAEQIHGISTALAEKQGVPLQEVLVAFNKALERTKFVVGQNVDFDINIMGCEFHRMETESTLVQLPVLDTCTEHTAELCKIPGGRGGKFKLPTLTELHEFLFGEPFAEAHNATADVEATTRCFLELVRKKQFTANELDVQPDYFERFSEANPQEIELIGLKHINLKAASKKIADALWAKDTGEISAEEIQENIYKKALDYRADHISEVDTYEEFKQVIEEKGGFVSAHWDGTPETEDKIKEETKATIRCIPLNVEKEAGKCMVTGKPSQYRVLFAKAY